MLGLMLLRSSSAELAADNVFVLLKILQFMNVLRLFTVL